MDRLGGECVREVVGWHKNRIVWRRSHTRMLIILGMLFMGVHETERLPVSQWHEMRRDAGEVFKVVSCCLESAWGRRSRAGWRASGPCAMRDFCAGLCCGCEMDGGWMYWYLLTLAISCDCAASTCKMKAAIIRRRPDEGGRRR